MTRTVLRNNFNKGQSNLSTNIKSNTNDNYKSQNIEDMHSNNYKRNQQFHSKRENQLNSNRNNLNQNGVCQPGYVTKDLQLYLEKYITNNKMVNMLIIFSFLESGTWKMIPNPCGLLFILTLVVIGSNIVLLRCCYYAKTVC